jgi:prepilin-type N-terminal cleavage/methylation domain-containing protein
MSARAIRLGANDAGFTLIELVVTLVLLGCIVVAATMAWTWAIHAFR